MSRMKAQNSGSAPQRIGVIGDFDGKLRPSRRRPSTSSRWLSSGPRPFRGSAAAPPGARSRDVSGMINSATGRARASAADQPKIASAWPFQLVTRPLQSICTTASRAPSMIVALLFEGARPAGRTYCCSSSWLFSRSRGLQRHRPHLDGALADRENEEHVLEHHPPGVLDGAPRAGREDAETSISGQ